MKTLGGRYLTRDDLLRLGVKSCGGNVQVHESCEIVGLERLDIGSNVRIDPWCILLATGHGIHLGSYIHIGAGCHLVGRGGIWIGDFSGLSQGVKLYSASDDYTGQGMTNPTVPERFLRVKLGHLVLSEHVIVGAGSVVLPDVTINTGASVGALSLVTKSLQSWGIYAGIPARRLRNRDVNPERLAAVLKREAAA